MAQEKSRIIRNVVFLMTGLFIISWGAVAVFGVRYAAAKVKYDTIEARYNKLKEAFRLVEEQVSSIDKAADRLAAGEQDRRAADAADFLEWKYLLRDQVAVANGEFSDRIKKASAQKADNELLNLLYYNMGLSNTLADNFDMAVSAFEEAVKCDPRDAASYYNLGLLYSVRGDGKKAVNCYKNYLAYSPKAANAEEVRERIKTLEK